MCLSVSCSGPIPTQFCLPVGGMSQEISPMNQHGATPRKKQVRFYAFELLSCLLMAAFVLSSALVHASDIVRIPVTTLPECKAFDANPKFIGKTLGDYLYGGHPSESLPRREARGDLSLMLWPPEETVPMFERVGAVTDGESRLLLVKQVPGPGRARWEITGLGDGTQLPRGKCEPLHTGLALKHPRSGEYYTIALYTPPTEFGQETAETLAASRLMGTLKRPGQRSVWIKTTWEDERTQRQYASAKEIILQRPPVVLVHGTYDNRTDCWNWGKRDDHYKKAPPGGTYRTDNLKDQLEARGFSVYLVNFQISNGMQIDHGFVVPDHEDGLSAADRWDILGSHFRDNEKVVWDGGRGDPGRGEGIKAALDEFRESRHIAVTQADVVGHSMGGVLIRVYAKGTPLLDAPYQSNHQSHRRYSGDWYRRQDNFGAGDINRIITIGSTHMGSHISGFLQHFSYIGEAELLDGQTGRPPNPISAATLRNAGGNSWARGIGDLVWWGANVASGKFPKGAFTDQIPGSTALMAIGATAVPAHAIAGVATRADLDLFKDIEGPEGLYRERMELIWNASITIDEWLYNPERYPFDKWLNPGKKKNMDPFLCGILERLGQPDDAAILKEELREIEEIKKTIREKQLKIDNIDHELRRPRPSQGLSPSAVQGIVDSLKSYTEKKEELLEENLKSTKKLEMLEEKGKLQLMAAVFGNDYTDYTVSLSSQLGGLEKPYVTIIPEDYRTATNGVLHGYEPRHKDVQKRVIELLEGGMEPFCKEGFPDIKDLPGGGKPPYYPPSDPGAFKPYGDLP
jgi:pimeloyl-ACP methyl ester carboxylesterase